MMARCIFCTMGLFWPRGGAPFYPRENLTAAPEKNLKIVKKVELPAAPILRASVCALRGCPPQKRCSKFSHGDNHKTLPNPNHPSFGGG